MLEMQHIVEGRGSKSGNKQKQKSRSTLDAIIRTTSVRPTKWRASGATLMATADCFLLPLSPGKPSQAPDSELGNNDARHTPSAVSRSRPERMHMTVYLCECIYVTVYLCECKRGKDTKWIASAKPSTFGRHTHSQLLGMEIEMI